MRMLLARFRNRADFLERYQPNLENGGIFLPTRKALEAGERVLLDIRMPELKDHMLMRGTIAWRQRGKRSEGVRAGLGIEFLDREAGKRDHLLALARGELSPEAAQRRHRRLPIDLEVGWRVPNEPVRHESRVEDIGTGGAFLRTTAAPPQGTSVVLELASPGAQVAHTIEGRVAWRSSRPGQEGIGVEFRCRDIGGMRRLRELIKRIERASEVAEA